MQVEHQVPEMHPEELQARQQRGENLIILDSRTPEEHRRTCIPGARSAPSGELALRITDLVPDPEATVVVHCAGRTRSIIGARLLQRMGWRHVYDLRNGTMGWRMAGLELEQGSSRLELPAPSPAGLAAGEAFAARVAAEDGVRSLTIAEFQAMRARAERENVYCIDVRTAEEYARGHIPGFQWFPGGQAVQRADDVVAVRHGQVVFACDGRVRATVTASWYRQMGFPNVYVVDGGTTAWVASGLALEASPRKDGIAGYDEGLLSDALPAGYTAARAQAELLSPPALQARLGSTPTPVVLYVDSSRDFSLAHVPGAHWLLRSWLELRVQEFVASRHTPVLVTCTNDRNSVLAAATLKDLGYQQVAVLDGGMHAWQQAGLPFEKGLSGVMNPPNDVLTMGTDRTWAEAIHYLQWEEELGKKYETSHP
jgi:rhodanese-related sulfurtransferase